MPSKVDICNEALNQLGSSTIQSLSDTSNIGVLCNRYYDTELDFLLRTHRWNSALREATLSYITDATIIINWDYKFLLPTDPYCLRILQVETGDTEISWEIRGRNLYSTDSVVDVLYVARITDPNEFDPMLYKVMVDLMAYRLAFPVTRSREVSEAMYSLYRTSLQDAMSVDSQERTPETIKSEDLLEAALRS